MYSERPYTCGRPDGAPCSSVTFSETANLGGRIKAYPFGTAFGPQLSFIRVNSGLWTFTVGFTQSQVDSSDSALRCPCDGGPDIGEHYFCESLIEEDNPGTKYNNHFFHNEVLWDEAGCSSSGDCCSRFDSPYFIRHLPNIVNTPIHVIICNFAFRDNFAIELIEFYVK